MAFSVGNNRTQGNGAEAMETENSNESTDENNERPNGVETEVRAVIEHNPTNERQEEEAAPNNGRNQEDLLVTFRNDIIEEFDDILSVLSSENQRENSSTENASSNAAEEENSDEEEPVPGNSRKNRTITKKKTKREKFDSGLGDEIPTPSDSDDENNLSYVKDFLRRGVEEMEEKTRHSTRRPFKARRDIKPIVKMRKTCFEKYASTTDSSSENENKENEIENKVENNCKMDMRMYESVYTEFMKAKIQELPLPPILKRYLNFYREF